MWFDYFKDMFNYDERKVACYLSEDESLCVDTVRVSDGLRPFETGISHKQFDNGEWVIVESYDTKEEAEKGHEKWVDIMVNKKPRVLEDCSNAKIQQMIDVMFNEKKIIEKGSD